MPYDVGAFGLSSADPRIQYGSDGAITGFPEATGYGEPWEQLLRRLYPQAQSPEGFTDPEAASQWGNLVEAIIYGPLNPQGNLYNWGQDPETARILNELYTNANRRDPVESGVSGFFGNNLSFEDVGIMVGGGILGTQLGPVLQGLGEGLGLTAPIGTSGIDPLLEAAIAGTSPGTSGAFGGLGGAGLSTGPSIGSPESFFDPFAEAASNAPKDFSFGDLLNTLQDVPTSPLTDALPNPLNTLPDAPINSPTPLDGLPIHQLDPIQVTAPSYVPPPIDIAPPPIFPTPFVVPPISSPGPLETTPPPPNNNPPPPVIPPVIPPPTTTTNPPKPTTAPPTDTKTPPINPTLKAVLDYLGKIAPAAVATATPKPTDTPTKSGLLDQLLPLLLAGGVAGGSALAGTQNPFGGLFSIDKTATPDALQQQLNQFRLQQLQQGADATGGLGALLKSNIPAFQLSDQTRNLQSQVYDAASQSLNPQDWYGAALRNLQGNYGQAGEFNNSLAAVLKDQANQTAGQSGQQASNIYNQQAQADKGIYNQLSGQGQGLYNQLGGQNSNIYNQLSQKSTGLYNQLLGQNDNMAAAAQEYLKRIINPQIQNQFSLAALGRSGATAEALAQAAAQVGLPLAQQQAQQQYGLGQSQAEQQYNLGQSYANQQYGLGQTQAQLQNQLAQQYSQQQTGLGQQYSSQQANVRAQLEQLLGQLGQNNAAQQYGIGQQFQQQAGNLDLAQPGQYEALQQGLLNRLGVGVQTSDLQRQLQQQQYLNQLSAFGNLTNQSPFTSGGSSTQNTAGNFTGNLASSLLTSLSGAGVGGANGTSLFGDIFKGIGSGASDLFKALFSDTGTTDTTSNDRRELYDLDRFGG